MQQTPNRLQFLLLAATLLTGTAGAGGVHRYTVVVPETLERLSVEACFENRPPRSLRAASSQAAGYLRQPRVLASGAPLKVDGRSLRLGRLAEDACIAYQVDLQAAARAGKHFRGLATRVGDDLVTAPQLWLWRPRRRADGADLEVDFRLAPGINVSAPWRTTGRSAGTARYRVGHTPDTWPARVAFGRFAVDEIRVPGATLRVASLGGIEGRDGDKLKTWLRSAAANVTLAYGFLPATPVQALVVPVGEADEPVPFGRVERGGFPAVQFFVDPSRPLREFTGDWTATHELAHLLLPFVSRREAWLSEGMATYYQNVLMARGGHYSPQRAWQKLHEGFQRGRNNTRRGQTLAEATGHMHRDRAYMRVYWTGAAMALAGDVELRERTGNRLSLDEALRRLGDCCLPSDRSWRAREVLARLDALTGEDVFMPLYQDHVDSSRFPALDGLYAKLGLEVSGGRIVPDDRAPLATLRRAIMNRPGTSGG